MTLILTQEQRKKAFERLGNYLHEPDGELKQLMHSAQFYNGWFTPEQVSRAVAGLARMLNKEDLDKWFNFEETTVAKKVGLILPGNIPMVGFHDILCVLASGHTALIKLSSQDQKLIPHLLKKLTKTEPGFNTQIQFTERLQEFDAIIATGSNNSSRYFEYYFGKVPHIIRKNRNSTAVLSGQETEQQLYNLGHDIFDYFGLGCRNVSKIYVPENYNLEKFFEAIESFKDIINHHKYSNNYDYNKSVYLVNGVKHLDNGFLLLKQDETLSSPLSVLFYEEYADLPALERTLDDLKDQIQVTVTETSLKIPSSKVAFGDSQKPQIWDYADNINTLDFLLSL